MSETELQKAIVKALEQIGCVPLRIQSGSIGVGNRRIRCARAGTPDLCVLCPEGETVWLEIKLEKGKLAKSQVEMHALMRVLGHNVCVARSVSEALAACSRVERCRQGLQMPPEF